MRVGHKGGRSDELGSRSSREDAEVRLNTGRQSRNLP